MFHRKMTIFDYMLMCVFIIFFGFFLLSAKTIFLQSQPKLINAVDRTADDEFDSSFSRLNTIEKLISYCDSFYSSASPNANYPGVVSEIIAKKFYRGYSFYGINNNAICVMLEPLVENGATAVVIPDDIVKYPFAACSQQSIVGMEVFKRKGYKVRKVSMFDNYIKVGHFAYEVFYDNSWHFFDTNEEPDREVLGKYNRPSIAFLAANPDIVLAAYKGKKDPALFKRLVLSNKIGAVNEFPAPHAYLFQTVTKWMSYYFWIILLGVMFLRYTFLRQKNKQPIFVRKQRAAPLQSAYSNL